MIDARERRSGGQKLCKHLRARSPAPALTNEKEKDIADPGGRRREPPLSAASAVAVKRRCAASAAAAFYHQNQSSRHRASARATPSQWSHRRGMRFLSFFHPGRID